MEIPASNASVSSAEDAAGRPWFLYGWLGFSAGLAALGVAMLLFYAVVALQLYQTAPYMTWLCGAGCVAALASLVLVFGGVCLLVVGLGTSPFRTKKTRGIRRPRVRVLALCLAGFGLLAILATTPTLFTLMQVVGACMAVDEHTNKGEVEEALSLAEQTITQYPKWPHPYAARGRIFTSMGEAQKAEADFAKARELGLPDCR